MNLVLLKPNELSIVSDADDNTDNRRDSNDENVSSCRERTGATTTTTKPATSATIASDSSSRSDNGRRCICILSSQDRRAKHIRGHLNKSEGQHVLVGVLGGSKGPAIVKYVPPLEKGDQIHRQRREQAGKEQVLHNKETKGKKSDQSSCTGKLQLELQFDPQVGSASNNCISPVNHPCHNITLVLALPFPQRLKALWSQVATLIGGYDKPRIIILRGELSDPEHCNTRTIQKEYYEPLIEEGLSQGQHTTPIQVDIEVATVVSHSLLRKLGLVTIDPTKTLVENPNDNSVDRKVAGATMGETNSASTGPICHDTVDGWYHHGDTLKLFLDCGEEKSVPPFALDVILRKFLNNDDNHREATSRNASGPTREPEPLSNEAHRNRRSIVVAIGPERGWTDDDAETFHKAGFVSATLGTSILRVDTAVLAGLGVVIAALDFMDGCRSGRSCGSIHMGVETNEPRMQVEESSTDDHATASLPKRKKSSS